ncbi:MAG TPA: alpha/beta hydrolase [Clostridiales bacterium]|nr:alpha/beta hydrolase [Clostridiales bacterium]
MKTLIKHLSNDDAKLTCYIHDYSEEMPTIKRRPAVLIFPGGGYMMCSDREADPVALSYLSLGYNAFVLRYTVGAKASCQKAFDDADEAMKYLRGNDWELRIDKDKIAVVGFSAGGHLAAWVSVLGEEKPNAAILGYPCTIAESGKMLGKEFPELIANVDSATPPTFLFAACDDKVVPIEHSIKYMEALDKAKVSFEAHIFAGGGHGFSLAKPLTAAGYSSYVNRDTARWFDLSAAWLTNQFGDFEVSNEAPPVKILDSNTPLGQVMDNSEVYAKFLEFFPALDIMVKQAVEKGQGDLVMSMSLRSAASVQPQMFAKSQLDALDEALAN